MKHYYLAIDIGASGGRHMLGHMEKGKLKLEEIYRFPNEMIKRSGRLCWDLERLFQEILNGMKKCFHLGKIPRSVGIDTWAVDFVLLDREGRILGDSAAYRDDRTLHMDERVAEYIEEKELYERTGIQKQQFNTIYQLMAVKEKEPECMEKARSFLMIPDYFHYLLTGKRKNEYTNATTTQLVSPDSKSWDRELIERLGYPMEIFEEIVLPGTRLGGLREEIRKEVGFDCQVVLPASHDTASAVMAVPGITEDFLYISSGTWSLLGTELSEASCSEESRRHNFTNEGGYDYRFRYLKNIMGLWMVQSVKKEIGQDWSYGDICSAAERERIPSTVDCDRSRFLAPSSMVKEIQDACRESGQQVPDSLEETASVIYQSLAESYGRAVHELEELTGKSYDRIHIVGGGANAEYLNRLTAKACQKKVLAGPMEATAIGNLLAQIISGGELESLAAGRACVYDSFRIRCYEPSDKEENQE